MLDWIKATLTSSTTGSPSTKRTVVAAAAGVLCVACLWVAAACAWWIYQNGDLGSGAMGALTLLSGVLAGLAGSAYRKPEAVGVEAPPAGGGATPPGNSLTSEPKPTEGSVGAADPGAHRGEP